jgi:type IV pilus assembly protein PilN
MIKINLVPLKEKKRQQEYVFMLIGAVVVVVLASGMFWFYIQKVQVKRDLNVRIKKVEEESKGYEEKIAEVTAFQDTEAKLEAANKNIKDVQTAQKRVLFVLDQVAINLPDGVWLTFFGQAEKDPASFVMDGYSFSLGAIKEYYDTLSKTQGLAKDTSLEIKSVAASAGNNKQIVQFEITTKATDTDL